MELKPNMYVRTDMGDISKIKSIWENERVFFENKVDIDWFTSDSFGISYLKKCKASYNLIDLIEVGDYVNGSKVVNKYQNDSVVIEKEKMIYEEDGTIWSDCIEVNVKEIETIVTKEQFKSVEYEVE